MDTMQKGINTGKLQVCPNLRVKLHISSVDQDSVHGDLEDLPLRFV